MLALVPRVVVGRVRRVGREVAQVERDAQSDGGAVLRDGRRRPRGGARARARSARPRASRAPQLLERVEEEEGGLVARRGVHGRARARAARARGAALQWRGPARAGSRSAPTGRSAGRARARLRGTGTTRPRRPRAALRRARATREVDRREAKRGARRGAGRARRDAVEVVVSEARRVQAIVLVSELGIGQVSRHFFAEPTADILVSTRSSRLKNLKPLENRSSEADGVAGIGRGRSRRRRRAGVRERERAPQRVPRAARGSRAAARFASSSRRRRRRRSNCGSAPRSGASRGAGPRRCARRSRAAARAAAAAPRRARARARRGTGLAGLFCSRRSSPSPLRPSPAAAAPARQRRSERSRAVVAVAVRSSPGAPIARMTTRRGQRRGQTRAARRRRLRRAQRRAAPRGDSARARARPRGAALQCLLLAQEARRSRGARPSAQLGASASLRCA